MSLDVSLTATRPTCVFDNNITHNLGKMAAEAGIYEVIWRPEEANITLASDLIKPLTEGLKRLKDDPDYFEQFTPDNGWGTYDGFVDFVERYLTACEDNPDAEISISR